MSAFGRLAAAALAGIALAAAPSPAHAQVSLPGPDGWAITLAGNVNVFTVFTNGREIVPGPIDGGRVPAELITRIRTGLLPSIVVLDVKTHEGSVDLGAHFGVGVQVSNASVHDNLDNGTQAGARIDMRQAYMTIGGVWGQVLAGRELSLYQRENILNDMTLFGTGATGGGLGAPGTTLGRSGFGYIYPNFNGQVTYASPASHSWQLSVGIFDPDRINGDFSAEGAAPTAMPRVETEATWHGTLGRARVRLWASAMRQSAEQRITARGAAAGLRLEAGALAFVASGYGAKGVGSTYALSTNLGVDGSGAVRTTYGYMAQLTATRADAPWTFGMSFGESRVRQTAYDLALDNQDLVRRNTAVIGMAMYRATHSLRLVGEYTRAEAQAYSGARNRSDQVSAGLLLFF
ncbi:MAG: porin [Bacillota bacterium]